VIKIAHLVRESIANCAMSVAAIRKWRVKSGRTVSEGALSDHVQLILEQFDFFIEAIGWDRVRDKTVIEIGPGDAIPHGLLFLGAGAKRYIAIDRFLGNIANPLAKGLYAALFRSAPERIQKGWGTLGFDPFQYPWLTSIRQGPPVAVVAESIEETGFGGIGSGDVIISFNVIEHLSNISRAFESMARMLNPGGLMIHRVDYGPHDLWRTYKNPLTFLSPSKAVWSLMGSHRGYPNRKRHSQVLSALSKCGFQNADRITRRFAMEDITAIRPFLSDEFRGLPDEDLQVADAEICSSVAFRPTLGGHGFTRITDR
jgi:SAM-dependent methyltransferase